MRYKTPVQQELKVNKIRLVVGLVIIATLLDYAPPRIKLSFVVLPYGELQAIASEVAAHTGAALVRVLCRKVSHPSCRL